jgi:fibronectin type 3 domain-containing protein
MSIATLLGGAARHAAVAVAGRRASSRSNATAGPRRARPSPARSAEPLEPRTLFSVPTAASGLSAVASSHTQVLLSWTDNSNNETGFKVLRSANAGAYALLTTTAANAVTYTDSAVSVGSNYSYEVVATNASGDAAATAAAAATVPLAGTVTGTAGAGSYVDTNAFDGSLSTFYDSPSSSGGWVGLDLGSAYAITSIAYAPRTNWAARMVGGEFQGSNTSDFSSGVTTFYTVPSTPTVGQLTTATAAGSGTFRYVRYFGNGSNYSDVAEVQFFGTTVPTAPSGLTATAVSATQVNLAWTDNSNNETGFKVLRSSNGGSSYTLLATTAVNAVSYPDTTAAAGTTYSYEVTATNGAGDSAPSNVATVTTVPAAPGAPTATAATSTQVNLSWPDVTGETGFVVQQSPNGSTGWTQVAAPSAGTLNFANTGLTAATTYYYRVEATDAGGASAWSPTASATTVPAAPTGLAATAASATEIDLSWPNVTGETGFLVQRSPDGSTGWTQVAAPAANTLAFANTGLTAGTAYYYRLAATDAGGASGWSATATATTGNPPAAASGLTAVANSMGQVYLAWTDNSNTETGFKVLRSVNSGAYALLATTAANATSYTDATVAVGSTYAYEVVATNASGDAPPITAPVLTAPLTGTVIGTAGSLGGVAADVGASAFDGSLSTFFDGPDSSGDWVGLDPGANSTITGVAFAPRSGYASRMTGGQFQGSNTSDFSSGVTTLYTVSAAPTVGQLTTASFTGGTFRYVRYLGPGGAYADVAEVQFIGSVATSSPTVVPAAASALTAVASSHGTVNLAWADNSTNESGFKILRSTNGGGYTLLATTAANATSYTDATVAVGSTYAYEVVATDAAGDAAAATAAAVKAPLTGTVIGTSGSYAGIAADTDASAFDGSLSTFFDGPDASGDSAGLDLGLDLGTTYQVTGIGFSPRYGFASRMVGGVFQGSNTSDFSSGVSTLYTVTATPTTGQMTIVTIPAAGPFRYVRYLGPTSGECDVAEVQFFGTPVPAPAAPTGLTATATSGTQVSLSWTDNSNNETGFKVLRSTNGGTTYTLVTTTPANTGPNPVTYADSGLSDGTAYTYEVVATNVGGDSAPTTGTATTPLSAPSGLSATAASATEVDLTWTVNSIDQTGFAVQRSSDGGATFTTIATAAGTATSYPDTTAIAGTTYAYRVEATDAATTSPASNVATATTVPAAPGMPTATAASSTEIDLSWPDVTGETGFVVQRSPDGSTGWTQVGTALEGHPSFPDTGLTPGTTYYYRVQAIDAAGGSAWSPTASMSTLAGVAPPTPSGLAATVAGSAEVDLSWAGDAGATGFNVLRSADGGQTFQTIATGVVPAAGGASTMYADTTVADGTAYQYEVVATNPAGSSAATAAVVADVPLLPVTGLTATADPYEAVDLAWSDATTAADPQFEVDRQNADGTWAVLDTVDGIANGDAYTDWGVTSDTTYAYRVRAVGTTADLDSAYDGPVSVPTPPTTPDAPTGLSATESTPGEVDLSWADDSATVSGYIVTATPAAGGTPATFTVAGNTPAVAATGLTAGAAYSFAVVADNNQGSGNDAQSDPSDPVTAVAPAATLSATVPATAAEGAAFTLTLASSLPGGGTSPIVSWQVAWDDGSATDAVTGPNGTDAHTLAAGATEATATVTATDSAGNVFTLPAATVDAVPNGPTGLTATAIDDEDVQLSWTPDPAGGTQYEVDRENADGTWTDLATVDDTVDGDTYVDSGMAGDTSYTYRVRSLGAVAAADSPFVGPATVSTPLTTPDAPTGLSATESTPGEVDLTWTDDSAIVTGYAVTATPLGGGTPLSFADADGYGEVAATGLTPGAVYSFTVTADNNQGNGHDVQSAPSAALTVVAPAATLSATAPATVAEGSAFTLALASTVPGGGTSPVVAWQVAWDDGSATDTVSGSGGTDAHTPAAGADEVTATVTATDAAGDTFTLPSVYVLVVPSAPTDVTATAGSESDVLVTWQNATQSPDDPVEILRSDDGGVTYNEVATVDAGTTSYDDTGLAASTAYSYEVESQAADGQTTSGPGSTAGGTGSGGTGNGSGSSGSATNATSTTASGQLELDAVAVLGSPGEVVLDWTYRGGDDAGYELEMEDTSVTGQNYSLFATPGKVDATGHGSYTESGLTLGDVYKFRIRVDKTDGTVSDYVGTTVTPQPNSYGGIATADLIPASISWDGSPHISLTWNGLSTSNAVEIEVKGDAYPDGGWHIVDNGQDNWWPSYGVNSGAGYEGSIMDPGVQAAVGNYSYRVRSISIGGGTPLSAWTSITSQSFPSDGSGGPDLHGSAAPGGGITVSWPVQSNSLTGVTLLCQGEGQPQNSTFDFDYGPTWTSTVQNGTEYATFPGLTSPGTKYDFVLILDFDGGVENAAYGGYTTLSHAFGVAAGSPPPPVTPGGLVATPAPHGNTQTNRHILLHWNNTPDNEDQFKVRRAWDSAFTWNVQYFTTGKDVTTYEDDTADYDHVQYYEVQSIRNGIPSPWSQPVSISPGPIIVEFLGADSALGGAPNGNAGNPNGPPDPGNPNNLPTGNKEMMRIFHMLVDAGYEVDWFWSIDVSGAYNWLLQHLDSGQIKDGHYDPYGWETPQYQDTLRTVELFGHSWGATSATFLARKILQSNDFVDSDVAIELQIDPVNFFRLGNDTVPGNVFDYFDFYQTHFVPGILGGVRILGFPPGGIRGYAPPSNAHSSFYLDVYIANDAYWGDVDHWTIIEKLEETIFITLIGKTLLAPGQYLNG